MLQHSTEGAPLDVSDIPIIMYKKNNVRWPRFYAGQSCTTFGMTGVRAPLFGAFRHLLCASDASPGGAGRNGGGSGGGAACAVII